MSCWIVCSSYLIINTWNKATFQGRWKSSWMKPKSKESYTKFDSYLLRNLNKYICQWLNVTMTSLSECTDSAVSSMTSGLGSFPGRDTKFFIFPNRSNLTWGPHSVLPNGIVSPGASRRGVKLASRLLLVSRLRISRRAAPLTMYLHGVMQWSTDRSTSASTER